jgi:hypothetical protein
MDIAACFSHVEQEAKFIAIVGYQKNRGDQPEYAAVQLDSPPRQLSVAYEQACNLPENSEGWAQIAISCFEYQGDAIPILNLNHLFNSLPISRT